MPSSPPQVFALGEIVAEKYRVERLIGAGGMSVVFAGVHLALEQPIALKVLRPELATTERFVARFLREARAAARIRGDHVGRVLDVGSARSGLPFIALELLEGEDLGVYLARRGSLPHVEAASLVLQACDGIARAHAVGIIHRDIKPGNLFLTWPDGEPCVKVIDFGLSKVVAGEELQSLTATSDVFGSPQYMSPEQIRASRDVDARTDVWSIGCVLHELLAGEPPFAAASVAALCSVILADPPRALRRTRPDVPEALEALVRQCLEKERSKRPASVVELAIALQPFTSSTSTSTSTGARIVDSLRRLRSFTGEEEGAPPSSRRPSSRPASTRSGERAKVVSIRVPGPSRLSPRVMILTGLATFALVLAAAFFLERAFRTTPPPRPTSTSLPR